MNELQKEAYNKAIDDSIAVVLQDLILNPKTQYQEAYNMGVQNTAKSLTLLKKS